MKVYAVTVTNVFPCISFLSLKELSCVIIGIRRKSEMHRLNPLKQELMLHPTGEIYFFFFFRNALILLIRRISNFSISANLIRSTPITSFT